MEQNKTIYWLLGILSSIAITLGSFALKWQFEANADIKVIQEQLKTNSEQVQNDLRHDAVLVKHWKLHGWERDEINKLRVKNGLDIESWPNLE